MGEPVKSEENNNQNLRDFSALIRAGDIFLSQAKRTRKAMLHQKDGLQALYYLLNETKKKRKTIHCTGMGRSGRAVEFFADLLKDLGFKVSVIGKTLALP
ncbi:MAG: hypothetical protein ACTSPT_08000, partial [Candidatus Heimdallarchaeota archaeon]